MVFVGEDELDGVASVVLLVYCDFFGSEDKGYVSFCLGDETRVDLEAEVNLPPYIFLSIIVDF